MSEKAQKKSETEINFYQVDDLVTKSIAPLMVKVLEENKRAFVFCENEVQSKEIDGALWNYGRNKFIPHATIFDEGFEASRQPILISTKEENLNSADYLIFLREPSTSFIKGFSRVFYFFEEKDFDAKIKPTNFYKKQNGKWVAKNL